MRRTRGVLSAAALSVAIVSGGWLMQRGLVHPVIDHEPVDGVRLYEQVSRLVQQTYIDPVPDSMIWRKTVDGMLKELDDPHTIFLSPDRLRRLNESTTGRYAGVGLQIDVRNGWITVVAPLAGGPAIEAGVATGDRIVEIDGKPTHEWTSDEAQRALRGAAGTSVKLALERPGAASRIPVTLVRREIRIRAVQNASLLRPRVGYVDLDTFSEEAVADLRRSIDSLYRAGARSMILDLRGDPGGLLDQGVAVADLFLDPGQEIVSMRGRTADVTREYRDGAPQAWKDLVVAVLVDSGSASASEIVAGALQDHDRALIVGATTFGKGSAQTIFPLVGGGALKMTIARWYTPLGRSISKPLADDSVLAATAAPREDEPPPTYRTTGGRTLIGGGGIRPDVVVTDSVADVAERGLVTALNGKIPAFRDALAELATAMKGSSAIGGPRFVVTPELREELRSRLERRGVSVPPNVWSAAAPVLDRMIGTQITRLAFGPEAEAARRLAEDRVIAATVRMLEGASSQRELLRGAGRRE